MATYSISSQYKRIGIVDDHNVYTTQVYTEPIYNKMMDDDKSVIVYTPRYRSGQKTTVPVKNVWSWWDFPFTVFANLVHDKRDLMLIPLEQGTFGSPLSLILVPLLMLFCRVAGIAVVINLQGAISLSTFDEDFPTVARSGVPPLLAKMLVIAIYSSVFRLSQTVEVFTQDFAYRVYEFHVARDKVYLVDFPIISKVTRSTRDYGYFLCFGNYVPRRGLEYLVEAWDIKAILIIAGNSLKDPEYFQRIKNLASGNQFIVLAQNISNESAEMMVECCTAMIFPYVYSDSMSGPLSMCLDYDKPVIASNIGIFKDLRDHHSIYLFEPRNADAIRSAVDEFMVEYYARYIRK